jgi:hypothetical protein
MLLRVCLSFLCLSSSCWRGYSRVILLGFDSYIMPVFQTLGILVSWDLAIFFDSCGLPDSYRCPRVFLSLVASCSW